MAGENDADLDEEPCCLGGFRGAAALTATAASAEKKYHPGASDTEIKIGNIMPYSGPASSHGVVGKTEAAYFNMINAEGGINGRKINFISHDDAYARRKRSSRRASSWTI